MYGCRPSRWRTSTGEPADHEGELFQYRFQYGDQPQLRDLRGSGHNLPLPHLVDGIDVIQTFAPLLISLVHGIDAQESRCAAWLWFPSLADWHGRGPGGLIAGVALPVPRRVAQPVEDSDNGSEFINYNVAHLLGKLLIQQTKSRAHHCGDNGLVEAKNGAVIRKHIGFAYIDAKHAEPSIGSTGST